jgi:mannan endo-1,4-beta-mannosidase
MQRMAPNVPNQNPGASSHLTNLSEYLTDLLTKIVPVLVLFATATSIGAQEPADTNASPAARAVLRYFHELEGRQDNRVLSGQFVDFGEPCNLRLLENVHERTGKWPAIAGVDYADFPRGGITTKMPNQTMIAWWKAGGLVSVSAHMYNPANTNGGGLRDKGVDLASLLKEGTETHRRWMRQLDQIAEGLQELEAAGVVTLWRPFHEMNGGWFWWGDQDPQTFQRVWRHMFTYYTGVKRLNHLLWVYGPNKGPRIADYYAGDAFVDIIGLDAYTDSIDAKSMTGYDALAKIKKPFGFTEYGPHGPSNPPGDFDYRRLIEGFRKDFPRTTFFMSWNAKWSLATNLYTRELMADPWVVDREELPAFK